MMTELSTARLSAIVYPTHSGIPQFLVIDLDQTNEQKEKDRALNRRSPSDEG